MDKTTAFRLTILGMWLAMAILVARSRRAEVARTVRTLQETNRALRRMVVELERSTREMGADERDPARAGPPLIRP